MLIKLLLIVILAISVALAIACRLLCSARRDRDIANRKLSSAYQWNAHLIGVIRVLEKGQQ